MVFYMYKEKGYDYYIVQSHKRTRKQESKKAEICDDTFRWIGRYEAATYIEPGGWDGDSKINERTCCRQR